MTLRGRLLVAEPTLVDPNFHRTVVFLIEHGEDGALGVVLNRPSETPVGEVVPAWAPYVSDPSVVHVGGPVTPEGAICLARCPGPVDSALWQPLSGEVGVLDLNGDPSDAPGGVTGLRIFAGYAGWTAGQLEAELDLDGWFVVDAEDADVSDPDPVSLWRRVLARQPNALRRFAVFPEDLSVN